MNGLQRTRSWKVKAAALFSTEYCSMLLCSNCFCNIMSSFLKIHSYRAALTLYQRCIESNVKVIPHSRSHAVRLRDARPPSQAYFSGKRFLKPPCQSYASTQW
jgi:hypothetical protein